MSVQTGDGRVRANGRWAVLNEPPRLQFATPVRLSGTGTSRGNIVCRSGKWLQRSSLSRLIQAYSVGVDSVLCVGSVHITD